jgi:hypothetical protein
MNLNHAAMVKHDLDKLITTIFIAPVEEVIWLSLIVIVPKKIASFKLCVWIFAN